MRQDASAFGRNSRGVESRKRGGGRSFPGEKKEQRLGRQLQTVSEQHHGRRREAKYCSRPSITLYPLVPDEILISTCGREALLCSLGGRVESRKTVLSFGRWTKLLLLLLFSRWAWSGELNLMSANRFRVHTEIQSKVSRTNARVGSRWWRLSYRRRARY